jgi:hypothetical protein
MKGFYLLLLFLVLMAAFASLACEDDEIGDAIGDTMTESNPVHDVIMEASEGGDNCRVGSQREQLDLCETK